MPFTFSHPAVILPFRYIGKKYFSISALIIGSITPDFEYFIRLEGRSRYSHTWPGAFWFDIPLALLICFLFHNLVRRPLLVNLPYFLYTRFMRFYYFNWNKYFMKNWIVVMYSALIGIFTHLISDRVTHKSYNFVTSVPGLIDNPELIDNPNSVYKIFQITYSIIGLALCFFTVLQLPSNKRISYYRPDIRYWLTVFCVFAAMLITIIIKKGINHTDYIVGTISSLMIALIVSSFIFPPERKLLPGKVGNIKALQENKAYKPDR